MGINAIVVKWIRNWLKEKLQCVLSKGDLDWKEVAPYGHFYMCSDPFRLERVGADLLNFD